MLPDIRKIVQTKLSYLKDNNVEASAFEIKILLADVLGSDLNNLLFYDADMSEQQLKKFDEYIELRKNYCPVDKIIGKKGFYKLDFEVNRDVLSPRYDTEILIDEAVKLFNLTEDIDILELGCGSGCIVVSLLNEFKNAKALGIDISAKALQTTKLNAEKNFVSDRLKLLNASWFDHDITDKISQKFDLIISNPPYIPSGDIPLLDNEVKNFDPIIALDGGDDGLKDYRRICETAGNLLKKNGILIFETGINQANLVVDIAKNNKLNLIKISKDYNGIERCVILKK